jgi:hypothetical protein
MPTHCNKSGLFFFLSFPFAFLMAGAGPPSRISVVAPSRSFSRSFLSHHIWFGPLPPPKKKSQIKTNRNDIWLVEIVSIEWKWKWKEKRNQTGSRESLSGGRCLCKQKKNIQCGGAERKWGGDPSCETIYCLDDWRFNFIIFNELSRHNETTTTTTTTRKRRRDFLRSPFILSCASFSILTRTDTGQQPSQPRVVFFAQGGILLGRLGNRLKWSETALRPSVVLPSSKLGFLRVWVEFRPSLTDVHWGS